MEWRPDRADFVPNLALSGAKVERCPVRIWASPGASRGRLGGLRCYPELAGFASGRRRSGSETGVCPGSVWFLLLLSVRRPAKAPLAPAIPGHL